MSTEFYGFDDEDFATNPVGEPHMLPSGCGYQGYEFGAGRYPDSQCFGGRLYDMDDCDGEGMIYEPGEYVPCPMCDPKGAIRRHKQDFLTQTRRASNGRLSMKFSKRDSARAARSLVRDIRRNRKNHTEPWGCAPENGESTSQKTPLDSRPIGAARQGGRE